MTSKNHSKDIDNSEEKVVDQQPSETTSEVEEEEANLSASDNELSDGQPDATAKDDQSDSSSDDDAEDATHNEEAEKLQEELQQSKDKYLRLYSEFENFRRRTAREKLELMSTANENLMVALLPVMDDFERAKKALSESEDIKAAQEGFELIFSKFRNVLSQNGLKKMDTGKGNVFDTEFHEAISQMPVEKKKMKGKIVEVVENGYLLNDKIIRFAKVVTGA
jgi:molecular chaperone GrpE